jgi:hypothetical protein
MKSLMTRWKLEPLKPKPFSPAGHRKHSTDGHIDFLLHTVTVANAARQSARLQHWTYPWHTPGSIDVSTVR